MTQAEARAYLLALLPDGFGKWLDLRPQSDPWKVVDGAAALLVAGVFSPLDDVADDANPVTATSAGLLAWEVVTGLVSTPIARTGSLEQRRAQVIARLREFGLPTLDAVAGAVAAICGYSPTIIEHDRATLRTLHARRFVDAVGYTVPASTTATFTQLVGDNAPCSSAGVQFLMSFDPGFDPSLMTVTITSPGGSVFTFGSGTDRPIYADSSDQTYAWPAAVAFAGEAIDGTWTLEVANGDPVNAAFINYVALFAEGIGRDTTTGAEGLGARIYEWSAAINEALCGSGYDRAAALSTVLRMNPAHALGGVALYQTDGALTALCDDDNCIADYCVVDA